MMRSYLVFHRLATGLAKCRASSFGVRTWVLAAVLTSTAPAFAHIIPPEKLHPVAESYRRAGFLLNLNPVLWEQVAPDVNVIANYWMALDSKAAGDLLANANRIIAEATRDPDQQAAVEPMPRAEAAERIFVLLTEAVSQSGQRQLRAAERNLEQREDALALMREARGIFGAFDDVLRATDRDAFRRLGWSWLEMSSALGSRGLLGKGVAPVEHERFVAAAREIATYMQANFGVGFLPVKGRKLAPWPARSKTFDASARPPIKLPPGHNINKQLPRPRQILNMATRGVDEGETTLIALGDMAFDSSFIFGEPAQSLGISCNSCHNKSITNPNFIIPGLSSRPGGMDVSNSFFAPHANNGHFDALDTPDLRGIRFTAPYGRNGRFESLTEFVRNVIVNEFNGPEPDPVLLDGLIAYMFEFDFLPNQHLNRDGALNGQAPQAALRGEEIFLRPFEQMGGMSCATCHVPSANFLDHKRHDLGTVPGAEDRSRDGALDTPTLLGIKHTPPYFHDGSQPTLRAVTEWFNDNYKLRLSEQELSDLTAYVDTVGDGVDAFEDTQFTLEAEMEEFSFFMSAYEFLVERNKPELMAMTFRTIAFEIRAHKWDLQDWTHMPVLERMAELMDQAYGAVRAGDRGRVGELVSEYRQTYEKYKDVLN